MMAAVATDKTVKPKKGEQPAKKAAKPVAKTKPVANVDGMKSAEVVTMTVPPRRMDVAGAAERADLSSLGGRISFARLRQRLTQAEVATSLGKSRATIVQYEQNNILPPIDVVEDIAKKLQVSPSFLAYGEATVPGLSKSLEMTTFAENRVGKDGSYVSGAYAFNIETVNEFGVEPGNFEAYVLNHDAPQFDLRSGDRLFIDNSVNAPTNDRDTYLLKTGQGVEIVRIEPDFTAKAGGQIRMTGPKGQSLTAKPGELEFIGAVVATLRKQ